MEIQIEDSWSFSSQISLRRCNVVTATNSRQQQQELVAATRQVSLQVKQINYDSNLVDSWCMSYQKVDPKQSRVDETEQSENLQC